jgi:GcrA cell cycle regulator
MVWTDHRVDELKKLWNEGKTASQIADELGHVTRNAVIGKAHRLGLSSRPSPIKRKTFVLPTTNERMCQWPIGDPGESGFHFCDHVASAGRPYCHEHCVQAYRRKSESAA